jgi:hypothetical protein
MERVIYGHKVTYAPFHMAVNGSVVNAVETNLFEESAG